MKRSWKAITILFMTLCIVMSLAHVLELLAKLRYGGQDNARIHTTLSVAWRPPAVGGFIEPSTIVSTLFLASASRGDIVAARLLLTAFGYMMLAFPVVCYRRDAPTNAAFIQSATTGIIPVDWAEWRMKWESGHAIRLVLSLSAFVLTAFQLTRGNVKTAATAGHPKNR